MTPTQTPSAATLIAAQDRAKTERADAIRAAWDALPARLSLRLPGFGRKAKEAVC